MLSYDSRVIYGFAERLYKQANTIVATYTVLGVFVGGVGLYVASSGSGALSLIGAAILGAIGYLLGSQRAFVLKLQAQTALCQVKIEENTRGGAQSESRGAAV